MPFPPQRLSGFFQKTDNALRKIGAVRVRADATPGYPCRVSLAEAEVGEELILLNYGHLPALSPYRSAHAIYVRKAAEQARPLPGEVPEVMSRRLLSVRAFGADDMMRSADVVEGTMLARLLEAFFADPAVVHVHIHNARQGCYAGGATRPGET